MGPALTLTVLFTDAVASSEALVRLGDERFGAVQQRHLDLLRPAVSRHRGREVKSLGDGLMVVFTGASDALGCAVEMQQRIDAAERRGEDGLAVRIGVALGDLDLDEGGDCHGRAVVEAARVCAAAGGGQVLATETVRAVAGSRGGHVFTPLAPVELKGLAEAVSLVEVGWAPLADAGGVAPVPLPPRLAFESSWPFVGRASEMERFDSLWREVVDGALRVALLAGEPGAGKSRLAREVAVRAHDQGGLVLFGRIDEELAVAYQPFAEALRHYLASVDEATRERVLGLRGGVLARLVPELLDQPRQGQVEAWAIFEGLTDWLAGEAGQRPVVLVLDDVQAAAKPTLGAFMHLVRSERLARVLIIGTYRDTEVDRRHPLAAALADLHREEGVARLTIRGLDAKGVEAFVQAAAGDALDEDARGLAELLSEQTQGNPFFVGQVLRHLAESGEVKRVDGRWVRTAPSAVLSVPQGVREVVGRRVSRLCADAGELLTVAAVAGPQFDTSIVAHVAGQRVSDALSGFDEAVGARLVLETDVPGQLRFAHALVRQTLEDELTTLRRAYLHRDIALAIETRFGAGESAVAELAHHFAEAAVAGEGERAAHYAERAAAQAIGRGAPNQAVDLFERALDLLPADADPNGRRRDQLYNQLARCCWVVFDQALLEDVCRRWLALGRELDDDVIRINAVLWLSLSFVYRDVPKSRDLMAFAEALRVEPRRLDLQGRRRFRLGGTWCDTDATALRASLLATLATSWAWGVPLGALGDALPAQTPLALADEAVRLARDSADAAIRDDVRLTRIQALAGSPDAEELRREAERTLSVGYRMGGGGSVVLGIALARLGRLDELRAMTEQMLRAAEHNGDLIQRGRAHSQQAAEALARGRLDEAQKASEQGLQTCPDELAFQAIYATLTVGRLLAAGKADDARHIVERLTSSPALDNSHLLGVVAAEQGDLDTARAILDEWHAAEHPLPADAILPGRLWGLAECAHAVGDRSAARILYGQLIPYDRQLLFYGLAFIPASAAFALGLLAETLGDRDRARSHYTSALAFEEYIRAQTLAARTRQALHGIR